MLLGCHTHMEMRTFFEDLWRKGDPWALKTRGCQKLGPLGLNRYERDHLLPGLAWLYPFFDVAWLASELFHSTRDSGYYSWPTRMVSLATIA